MTTASLPLFAVCAPGLEAVTTAELRGLGISPLGPSTGDSPSGGEGGIEFNADMESLFRANLQLRTASRILLRLGTFHAVSFVELRKRAASLPWEQYLRPGQAVALRVTCRKSRLYHSDAVAERVAGAIGDRLRTPPDVRKLDENAPGDPPQLIVVRFLNDECTLSLDTSGALLHRRGYRQALAKAPLRETLAAGLLLAAGWDGTTPLIDPFCGSGTIPIEAALLACKIPPGHTRRFAFQRWPGHPSALWQSVWRSAQAHITTDCPPILASDRDAGAVQMAGENAQRAGVFGRITFTRQAVSAAQPTEVPGWIITNPPYGVRVSGGKDLRDLYAQFGNVLRSQFSGWRVALLCSEDRLAAQMQIPFERSLGLVNGGLPVKLVIGQVD